jgi:acetyltransferase-like isoleucine patch superfamily enzyme
VKILSITIPTYNRCDILQENLDLLLPQLKSNVEILIFDNHSTDSTQKYCKSLGKKISYFRQLSNIGADRNMMECLRAANGEYIWLLCDDDLPAANAVDSLIGFLETGKRPGIITLRTQWCGKNMEGYSFAPVATKWEIYDKNSFLKNVGDMLTFCSAIVVRKDVLDMCFIESFIGTNLVPAAIALQAAGKSNLVAMPCEKILFGRSGNAGGYDAYTVFSKNLSELLSSSKQYGYARHALSSVYTSTLKGVMLYIISVWPKTFTGIYNLFKYSFYYKEFYSCIIPALFRSLYQNNIHKIIPLCFQKNTNFSIDLSSIEKIQDHLDIQTNETWYKSFFNQTPNGSVKYPCHIVGKKYIKINSNFHAGPGLRLEAWGSYAGERHNPEILIGSDVCLNSNVHIGAINSIVIGNRVLVGSNVLITDHTHGRSSMADLSIPPLKRKLFSKGPVIIEDDVLIGENVSILPGVRIGKASIIGAGAVVTKDIPPFSIAKGVPATSTLIEC